MTDKEQDTKARRQEAFNKVWKHFVEEGGKRSVRNVHSLEDGTTKEQCAYRGEAGTKCAVGLLLPDEAYSRALEGTSARVLAAEHPSVFATTGLDPKEDAGFASNLQDAHDYWQPDEGGLTIAQRLATVASNYGLLLPSEPS